MFGMSVFQSVLERLKAEDDDFEEEPEAAERFRSVAPPFVGDLRSVSAADSGAVHRAYIDTSGDEMLAPPKPLPKPVMPPHLCALRPEDIAADLSLGETETQASLAEKRRNFAARNHPDRHHPDFRANATIRMKIANMLIDEAQRRLRLMLGG